MDKLFSYTDYRLYLRDFYSEMKRINPVFSYRWFAQKAGLSSAGLYQRVVNGERNLTETTTEQFVKGMALAGSEADYFRALVGFNQADTPAKKQQWYAVMLSMAEFVKQHQLETDEYRYLNRWYHPVIRELVTMRQCSYEQLARAVVPAITPRQAQSAVELLQRIGFIEQDQKGRWFQRDPAITSGKSVDPMLALARRSFNRQMITLAAESLDRFDVNKRFASGITVGISESCYEILVQEMTAFRERIAAIVDRDRGESQVYQVNFQIFPLSQNEGEQ